MDPERPQYRIEDLLTAVQTLTLRPGDVVALMTPLRLSVDARARLIDQARHLFSPDVKIIVLEEGMTLARVTVEEAHGSSR